MNYGFVPGGTKFEDYARNYIEWRPNSEIVPNAGATVESFVDALETSTSVERPIEDLAIGCHGHPTGILGIRLDSVSPVLAYFADVQRATNNGSISIPPAVLFPRPMIGGIPMTAKFRIIGCSIGAAPPYLQQLKTALGGLVSIVATPFEDAERQLSPLGLTGVLRMLEYDFRVTDPLLAEGNFEVKKLFEDKHKKWFDGTPIKKEFWERRVPENVFGKNYNADTIELEFNPRINGANKIALEMDIWEHKVESVGPYPLPPPTTRVATSAERRSFVRDKLKTRPEFAANHPFPYHKQQGYATYDEFIDGFDWLDGSQTPNQWKGYRYLFIIRTPVTNPPGSKKVLFDWVTKSGAETHLGLPESDSRLFVTV